MWKKKSIDMSLVVVIIVLFSAMNVAPSGGKIAVGKSSTPTVDGKILYVGGNGTGNYTEIQEAIDNASNGDTIFVYSGIYYENVIIDKSVNLTGEDINSTIIDGSNSSDTVHVTADWVNINSFTVQNCSNDRHNAGIKIVSNHNSIKSNKIAQNHGTGIIIDHSFYNNIQNNSMTNNKFYYIYLKGSSHTIVQDNLLYQSEDWHFCVNGIAIFESSNNLICNNKIRNLRPNVGIGCWDLSNNNTIQENTICDIEVQGSNMIQIKESHFNTIIDNKLKSSNGNGMMILFSSDNKILNNTIESVCEVGIGVAACKYTLVKNNNVSSNGIGISIGISSYLNTIQSNNIINNGMGVELIDFRIDPHIIGDCILNKIKYNNFIGNKCMAYDDNLFALNIWYGNYWNRPRVLPKTIFGIRTIGDNLRIPVIHFDLRPAREPHEL